ncbi:MAG: hypothetical protein LBJ39_04565, partial [Tannerellaceae bacterium]|nr:hypothetical protein [Tannerellaceae bacterium]
GIAAEIPQVVERSATDEELQRIARPRQGARPNPLLSSSPHKTARGRELYYNKDGLWPRPSLLLLLFPLTGEHVYELYYNKDGLWPRPSLLLLLSLLLYLFLTGEHGCGLYLNEYSPRLRAVFR